MVHMYSKSGNLALAKQTFESLRSQGFQPDRNVYNSMIMAYVNAGDHKSAESELRILESNHSKSSEDIYLAVLQAYAQQSDPAGAERIVNRMSFAGYQPSRESLTYLVEAYSRKGHPDDARKHFDDIIKMGYKPDHKCIARMIQAYAQKNFLDQGLSLLLQLEKDGIEHGPATYSVLIDWLGISPSLDVHISLCDMYSRVGQEKKALQALGVIEANKEKLSSNEFEKVIRSLCAGKFWKDAERVRDLMIDRGFTPSVDLNMSLQASRMFDSNNKKPSRKLF
ncbi:uncharacterized protein [Rutidosis leptorrhynchoides]|uniref:uncharacterized protein n=1 Tax=Rutidosis leptorrhynchoides TaxID=125765 RepID=UPI003A994188